MNENKIQAKRSASAFKLNHTNNGEHTKNNSEIIENIINSSAKK